MSMVCAFLTINTSWGGSDPYYRWDETRTPSGAHRCSSSAQCDGSRTCSDFGWCQGVARAEEPPSRPHEETKPGWGPPPSEQHQQHQPGWEPPPPRPVPPPPRPSHRDWNPPPPPRPHPVHKDEYYHWDETRNPGGAHRCSSSTQCDGMRTCSEFGWCQGTARPERRPPVKDRYYHWNELNNPLGPHKCRNDYQCDGARICSDSGYCFGRAR